MYRPLRTKRLLADLISINFSKYSSYMSVYSNCILNPFTVISFYLELNNFNHSYDINYENDDNSNYYYKYFSKLNFDNDDDYYTYEKYYMKFNYISYKKKQAYVLFILSFKVYIIYVKYIINVTRFINSILISKELYK